MILPNNEFKKRNCKSRGIKQNMRTRIRVNFKNRLLLLLYPFGEGSHSTISFAGPSSFPPLKFYPSLSLPHRCYPRATIAVVLFCIYTCRTTYRLFSYVLSHLIPDTITFFSLLLVRLLSLSVFRFHVIYLDMYVFLLPVNIELANKYTHA